MERYHMFKLGFAILFYASNCIHPMLVSGLRSNSLVTNQTLRPEDYMVFYQGVDGTPGVDFPVLSFIPRTTFSCDGIDSGYYADLDTDCQVFHICEEGKKISFLCPNGTIFEQADLICEWWYKVNCTNAPNLYQESAEFLREDLARRKASRKISLSGQERNHGAVMRIEESASVSAQQNGRPLRIGSNREARREGQHNVDSNRQISNSGRSNNLVQSAINKNQQNVQQKRYNDADTANFVNNEFESNKRNTGQFSAAHTSPKEKQVYTRSTTPSTLGGFSSNIGEIPSRKHSNGRRGNIKFSSGFGSKVANSPGSTLKPSSDDEYDLEFPKHRSEIINEVPSPKNPTVKIDSSKIDFGKPKQKSTVNLNRNDILNRRFESSESDELQIPQETAAFAPNTYNSVQSNTRKFTTINPHPNHRPTYSDLKRPDFSSTKFVNTINSVTPQYITTQSINNGKPFVGSTVGVTLNKNSVRSQQNGFTIPISTTERSFSTTIQPIISDSYHYFDDNTQGVSSTPEPATITTSQYFEHNTKKTFDHATVYGTFSRGTPTTAVPPAGVEVKLGKNVDKVSIQLSKSLGGEPPKYSSTGAPQLAADGFVRISGGIGQTSTGNGVQVNLGRGTIQSKLPHQGSSAATVLSGTVLSDTGPSEAYVTNFQSTTAYPDVPQTDTTTVGNFENSVNTGRPSDDGYSSQPDNNIVASSTEKSFTDTSGGITPVFGNTVTPNVQVSAGFTGSTGSTFAGTITTLLGGTGSTLIPNAGYGGNRDSQTTDNIVTAVPTEGGSTPVYGITDIGSNYNIPTSSIRPDVSINEYSRNTLSPPVRDIHGFSTISSLSHATSGAHSQVTDLLPLPENTNELGNTNQFGTKNATNSYLNAFRPNFYPTRSGKVAADFQKSKIRGSSFQTTPRPTTGIFVPDVRSTVQPTYSNGLPVRPHLTDINSSQNDIGSTLSPLNEISTYGAASTIQTPGNYNDFRSFSTTPRPFRSEPTVTTNAGFFVTRNSIYSSTTSAPFGFSKVTTSNSASSTPFVNISPNSGDNSGIRTPDITLTTPYVDSTVRGDLYLSKSESKWPRPFQKSLNAINDGSPDTKTDLVTPTYHTYKISSARPFELPRDKATPAPTIPTPFTTARSVQENVDNMINALENIVGSQDYSSETPRPGLVVPPSAGPQTLHTLAQYFASALDGIIADRENKTGEALDQESKDKLTGLLTQMTMYRYNQLFKTAGTSGEEDTTETTTAINDELQGDDSNNLVETPELRQLARNFSLALSSYLNDPDAFRKELESLRPTEPPPLGDENTEVVGGDEELLNFSDADSKSNFPPLFPTPNSPAPTWGYIVAAKDSNELDVKNSLNPDLHTADTQSFVPGFNNLAVTSGKGFSKGTTKDVPSDHWTTSPGVTKLWQSALSINPAILNENLENTQPLPQTTEPYVKGTTPQPIVVPHSEIQYDLRSLPKLSLNSTQVHGILIDFVNTTKTDDSNRLQRLLKKLNTTEDEFLNRMKEIESNPLTKRLILLLISECGVNATKDFEKESRHVSVSDLLDPIVSNSGVSGYGESRTVNSYIPELVDPHLQEGDQDTRALQLLNSLYSIASKFGK